MIDTGWTPISILPGFAAQDPPGVRKIGNVVYAKGGWANNGMGTNGTYNVGTIPAGFIPVQNCVAKAGTASGGTSGTLFVTADGNVQIRTGPSLSAYYIFGGQSWLTT